MSDSRANESQADLENRTRYHPATTEERKQTHQLIREMILDAMSDVQTHVPPGRERSLAITKLEEAMFWANAGIARQPDGPVE